MEGSVNDLIDDLLQTVPLDVDRRALKDEFLRSANIAEMTIAVANGGSGNRLMDTVESPSIAA